MSKNASLRAVFITAVASIGLLLAGSLPASAATTVTATNVTATVSGSSVAASATFFASATTTLARAGICVRDVINQNVDFPLSDLVPVSTAGKVLTATKVFAPGTYQYWACAKLNYTWIDASPRQSFTVEVTMPTTIPGALPGWKQVFADDFTTNVARGGFPGPYASKWMSYDNFQDTSGKGWYDKSIISAQNGALDLFLNTSNGKARGAAPVPLVNGQWGGQVYGRFSVRMKTDAMPNYGAGFLLWPDSGNWNDGEIDFPESGFAEKVKGYNHCVGNAANNCLVFTAPYDYTAWHIYTIEWTPGSLKFFVDGFVVASTTTSIPTKPLHWVMQAATTGVTPDPTVSGHVQLDWATIYTYAP